jgi:hypothetical protein
LVLYPFRTNRHDEPLRCSLEHVSLNHTLEYKTWEKGSDPSLRFNKKVRAWRSHVVTERNRKGTKQPNALLRHKWGDYTALSYNWGSNTGKNHIIVNGKYVSVTENLESGLRALQAELTAVTPTLRLWVDALCIDQSNQEERGREVRRMREIYGDSAGVLYGSVRSLMTVSWV